MTQAPAPAPPRPGDDPAFAVARLLELHGPRIRALALRLHGNAADADDLVQDVFLQAFRKWGTFRGASDPGTWLYTIALRAGLRGRKAAATRRTRVISDLAPWGESTVMQAAASPAGRGSAAERREAVRRVQSAIADLPEHLRAPIVLKEIFGVPVSEVASALALAPGTVKTRLHRGRLALRKAMIAGARAVPAPEPVFDRRVCLDLLKAKLASMDRGGVARGFTVPRAEACARCRAVFRELDLVQDACASIGSAEMPAALREAILRAVRALDTQDRPPARGRRPVQRSARRPGAK